MINIYDYETLGQNTLECPVISAAFMTVDEERFASDNPYTFKELCDLATFMKFDVAMQVTHQGKFICNDTLSWWKDQGPEALAVIAPKDTDVPLELLYPEMAKVFTKSETVFTRGNTFDPVITEFRCKELGLPVPYEWWDIRDTRSFIDGLLLGSGITNLRNDFSIDIPEFKKHNPVHDIAMDILRIQKVIGAAYG